MKYTLDVLNKELASHEAKMAELQSSMNDKNAELQKLGAITQELKLAIRAIKTMV